MADKYLNLQGLAHVAEKVNLKLRTVTTMPSTPELDDTVLYKGATTARFEQGGIYSYKTIGTYYGWSDTTDTFYTKSATPEVGDTVYSDTIGTDSGYTITNYDSTNNQIEFNSLTYDRDSDQDTPNNQWIVINGAQPSGYAPQFIDDALCFYYGLIPEIEGTSIIFDLTNGG